ncbi:phage tail protein [Aeromicrobium sp. CFBP 8757]|uniref:phage tail protein n=1 Tax=Aeromicrobium sp. CFBP 8757 TaxID=2775288 RepID=UPI00178492DB|nr:tail fiber protein [Aeromicrobium sp. CFBP 8757]MBD8608536.1 phage tail protein [Aeromicrobium sp. CFBP 8757]
MTEPFIGEICQVGFNFAPDGWALCNGALLPIRQYTALYSIIGVQFGGDGKTTFALPDLNGGRFTVGTGQGPGLDSYQQGDTGGAATVALSNSEMPAHTHTPQASSARGDRESPAGATWAQPHYGRSSEVAYTTDGSSTMSPAAIGEQGGGQPHNNMPPYQAVTFIIALQGIYPQRP